MTVKEFLTTTIKSHKYPFSDEIIQENRPRLLCNDGFPSRYKLVSFITVVPGLMGHMIMKKLSLVIRVMKTNSLTTMLRMMITLIPFMDMCRLRLLRNSLRNTEESKFNKSRRSETRSPIIFCFEFERRKL